jgi:hypothetical protein
MMTLEKKVTKTLGRILPFNHKGKTKKILLFLSPLTSLWLKPIPLHWLPF